MSSPLEALLKADPAAAHKLLAEIKETVVVPHSGGQQEVIDSEARYKVLNCGRRYGKTKIGVKMMVNEANKPNKPGAKKKLIWWVAPTYKVVKRGYAETLRQIPRGLLEHDPPPETNFDAGRSITLRLKYSNIEFYSAERPGGMLGEGVNFVVLDEAATIPSTVWEQVIRPTLADTKGGGVLLSTPRGRNWFYKRWKAGQSDSEPDWKSWTFTTYDNPYIDESEIDAMKAEMPTVIFDQEVLAKFVADGSAVFMWEPHQVEKKSVLDNGLVEDAKVKGHVFVGVDLAKTADFTVLYGANEGNRRNVFYDRFHNVRWSEQKRRIRRAVRLLEKAGADGVTLVMDATGVGDPIVEDMEDAGFDVISVNFTTLKEKMVRRFAKDLESGRAFLLDRALGEFEDYQMNMTSGGRIQYSAPGGSHDDVVSAKILQHHGITTEGSPNIELLSASEEYDAEAEDEEEFEDEWSDLGYDDEDDEASPQERAEPTPEEIFARPEAWN